MRALSCAALILFFWATSSPGACWGVNFKFKVYPSQAAALAAGAGFPYAEIYRLSNGTAALWAWTKSCK